MFENLGGQVRSGIGIAYWVAIGFIILGAIVTIVMYFMLQKRYNKQVEIRKVVNNVSVVTEDRCREYTDDAGNKWWLRWKEKDKILMYMPEPPSSAINITDKGKYRAVAKLVEGHYFWIEDNNKIASIPSDLFKDIPQEIVNETNVDKKMSKERIWKEKKIIEWKEANGVTVSFHPLTSNQRAIYVNSLRRAEERKMKGWQTQLPMIVGVGAAVILVLALLIFYGNIAKPVLEMGDKLVKFEDAQTQQLEIIQQIKQDIQVMKGTTGGNAVAPGGG